MKYAAQTQEALDRLDHSLRTLRDLIKRGQNEEAIRYMEEGDLKERFGFDKTFFNLLLTRSSGLLDVSNFKPIN